MKFEHKSKTRYKVSVYPHVAQRERSDDRRVSSRHSRVAVTRRPPITRRPSSLNRSPSSTRTARHDVGRSRNGTPVQPKVRRCSLSETRSWSVGHGTARSVASELDRAGRQAQRALDEGRLRLDLYRARQSVDRFAQRFGYAVYRAKKAGTELPAEEITAHMNNLTAAEARSRVSRRSSPRQQSSGRMRLCPTEGSLATVDRAVGQVAERRVDRTVEHRVERPAASVAGLPDRSTDLRAADGSITGYDATVESRGSQYTTARRQRR